MRVVTVIACCVLLASEAAPAKIAGDCPAAAAASATFEIVNELGRPLSGANLSFTARNWASTLSELSDGNGKVTVRCVPVGRGYDVTVFSLGHEVVHVSANAYEEPRVARIVMRRRAGRYVRVMLEGAPVPGVSVTITDAGGDAQVLTTDQDGFARCPELTGQGDALIEVSLAGLVPQRSRVAHDRKNGPLVFEVSPAPMCTYLVVR